MKCRACLIILMLIGNASARAQVADLADYGRDVRPFLERHCVRCHGDAKQKGNLRVDTLERDFAEPRVAGHWTEIMDRINSGEMPPAKEPRAEPEQVARVAEWIASQLTEAEAARQATAGEKVSFRRLSREEYRNTIRDLLGVSFDAERPRRDCRKTRTGRGSSGSGLGPLALGRRTSRNISRPPSRCWTRRWAWEDDRPKTEVNRWTGRPSMLRIRGDIARRAGRRRGLLDKVRAWTSSPTTVPSTRDELTRSRRPGGVRLPGEAQRAPAPKEAGPPGCGLYATDLGRDVVRRVTWMRPRIAPTTLEFRAHLPVGTHLIRIVNAVPGPNPEERGLATRSTPEAILPACRPANPGRSSSPTTSGKPLWPTILLDSTGSSGRGRSARILAPAGPSSVLFFAGRGGRDQGSRPTPGRSSRGSPTRAYRRPVRPGGAGSPGRSSYETVEAAWATASRRRSRTALGRGALLGQLPVSWIEGSTAAQFGLDGVGRLGTGLAALVFPLELDARRPPDGTRSAGVSLHEAGDPCAAEVPPDDGATRSRRRSPNSFPRQWLQLRRVGMFAAGQEALSRLRRISRNEHGRRDRRVLRRGPRPRPARSASSSPRTGRCSMRSSPATTRIGGVEGPGDPEGRPQAGRPPGRGALAGVDPRPHLRRHEAPAGPPGEVGPGVDLRATPRRRRRRTSPRSTPTPPDRAKTSLRSKIEAHRERGQLRGRATAGSTRSAWRSSSTTPSAGSGPSRKPSATAPARTRSDRCRRRAGRRPQVRSTPTA